MYQLNIPTKIYYGRNIWRDALRKLTHIFQGNVMIVTTGRSLIRLGYLDELKKEISETGCVKSVVIFDGISVNPRVSEVQEGIALGRKENISVVVGFGGGSAIDAAKAIAVGMDSKEDIEDFLFQGKEPQKSAKMVVAIPTTAGTGSELSKAAILTAKRQEIKGGIRGEALFPAAAVVDSIFTESVPLKVTMETGFDVLAHAIESYLSKASSPYTQMLSENAIQIVGKCLPRLFGNLKDVKAREEMSFASMIMGINLANTGTALPHRLQYPLGAHTDSSHGAGLAALYPAWISCGYQFFSERIERALSLLTGEEIHGIEKCVGEMRRFLERLGLSVSLQDLGVQKEDLPDFASEVTGNIKNDPAGAHEGIVLKIYEEAWG